LVNLPDRGRFGKTPHFAFPVARISTCNGETFSGMTHVARLAVPAIQTSETRTRRCVILNTAPSCPLLTNHRKRRLINEVKRQEWGADFLSFVQDSPPYSKGIAHRSFRKVSIPKNVPGPRRRCGGTSSLIASHVQAMRSSDLLQGSKSS
jgi:hypothetical protein